MVTIGAHESVAIRTQYRTPACAGTGHITARVTSPSGQPLAERTAALVIMAPPSEPTG
jgi:hypothetical protein